MVSSYCRLQQPLHSFSSAVTQQKTISSDFWALGISLCCVYCAMLAAILDGYVIALSRKIVVSLVLFLQPEPIAERAGVRKYHALLNDAKLIGC
jgi:hypothetical protein